MVLSELFVSLVQVVTKPWFLVPMLLVLLISGAVATANSWALEKPLVDLVLYYDSIPMDNIIGLMFTNYPLELAALAVSGLVMSVIGVIGMLSIVRLSRGEKLVDSINESVMEWKKALVISIIFWIAFFIFAAVFGAIAMLGDINGLLSTIVAIIFFIILLVVSVKVVFTIPALAEKEPKKAIQESWKYTDKRFWGSLVLVVLALFISVIVAWALTQAGIFLGDLFEPLLTVIGDAFGSTYFVVALTNYFYAKQ